MNDLIAALRARLDEHREEMRSRVPADRPAALLALLAARETSAPGVPGSVAPLDAQPPAASPGWNTALRLCIEPCPGAASTPPSGDWAMPFLDSCDELAAAETILAECETGYRQLHQRDERSFDTWITTRLMPTERRERADFTFWGKLVARHHAPERAALADGRAGIQTTLLAHTRAGPPDPDGYAPIPALDDFYRRIGALAVRQLAYQHSNPPGAAPGGLTFAFYHDLLALLIGWHLRDLAARNVMGATIARAHHEPALVAALAVALGAELSAVREAVAALTLDAGNAAYHAALPGLAAPPIVRLDAERLALSTAGLLGEPFVFLTRELRRRHGVAYHNAAHLREGVFRDDLAWLFGDRRFVRSAGRIELKVPGGAVRTDIDALVFDRKTGTLGVFELKAQDPFARTVAERLRQRDNFYAANRQVGTIAQWIARGRPDALLTRMLPGSARGLRVQKVHLFVLGRYLAHFTGGPAPDRRAAWGSWPQVLRLVNAAPFGHDDPNPLATLHARLTRDTPLTNPALDDATRELALGDLRLRAYPSFAAYRQAAQSV